MRPMTWMEFLDSALDARSDRSSRMTEFYTTVRNGRRGRADRGTCYDFFMRASACS